eukprot:CAMPEP_0168773478 /NCGR_PEP_ID=MMETSP0725-20121227/4493_1 /TAXON_ID=265536 /ORGANISM="Amphiprora sp., Strain CCMP467" /LENGTH=37 /DNA_ID= /DNA_START= /DNA_END= /DNA_ORIENTATION=
MTQDAIIGAIMDPHGLVAGDGVEYASRAFYDADDGSF